LRLSLVDLDTNLATLATVGGIVGDLFGPPAPFEMTLVLLVLSTLLSALFLPYIVPQPVVDSSDKKSSGGIAGFLAPLKVFLPRVIEKEDGGDRKRYWGLTLLGIGTFIGVFATA
jgi:hypothetical protein